MSYALAFSEAKPMTEEGSTTHSARSPITSRRMLGLLSNLDHQSAKRKTPALGRLGFRWDVIGCLVASRADKHQLTIGHVSQQVAPSPICAIKTTATHPVIWHDPRKEKAPADVGAKSNHCVAV